MSRPRKCQFQLHPSESLSRGEALRIRKDGRSSRATGVWSQSVARCSSKDECADVGRKYTDESSQFNLRYRIQNASRFYARCNIEQELNVRESCNLQ